MLPFPAVPSCVSLPLCCCAQYVVLLSNFTRLGNIVELFEFTHPNFGPNGAKDGAYKPDNTRFK